jgi:low temperature requirement protein LtrA
MNTATPAPETLHHHSLQMGGRDPHEAHRAATPLELFFDLTFVTSFAFAASHYAHALAEGHYGVALIGFGFASFAICWAWVNFSWFASAYDTDDWIFRVATMVQMIGVLILAIGLPRMFASIEPGEHFDNSVMVLGYVVMRVALVFQWLRAARQNPARRHACLTYAIAISVAQVGWVALSLSHATLGPSFAFVIVLVLVELAGPVTVLTVAVPVSVFIGSIYALYTYLLGSFDRFHSWLLIATAAVVALAVVAALSGIDMAVCLIILMFAPVVTVVGYEMKGYRHQVRAVKYEEVEPAD